MILHPVLMPTLAAVLYFLVTPLYYETPFVRFTLMLVFGSTYLVPVLAMLLMYRFRIISDFHLAQPEERRIPILVTMVSALLAARILWRAESTIIAIFFIAMVVSLMMAYVSLKKYKVSLHAMGVAGVVAMTICMGLMFSRNVNYILAALFVAYGAVCTARLRLKAHNYKELILGSILGVIPQFCLYAYVYHSM